MTDKEKIKTIKAEIHRLVEVRGYSEEMADDLFAYINSLPNKPISKDLEVAAARYATEGDEISGTSVVNEEPASEELKEAAEEYARKESEESKKKMETYTSPYSLNTFKAFIAGANWQKEIYEEMQVLYYKHGWEDSKKQTLNSLWKDAQGDDLPEIDREVIALQGIKVVFAHRPDPKGFDRKSLSNGETKHYTPKTYDKGGWNMEGITYWLDAQLPEGIE